MGKTRKKNFNFHISFWMFNVIALIILIFLFINIIVNSKTNALLDLKIAQVKEALRPADIDIIILKDSSCMDCFDVQPMIEAIRKENVKINSETTSEITSPDGLDLINKYNINKAPTFIITGEVEKNISLKDLWPKIGEVWDNTFILRKIGTPYKLISTGEIKGRARLVMLTDLSCAECYDVFQHEIILGRFGFPVQNQEIIDIISDDGKELIKKYSIKLLPTVILIGDIDAYPSIKSIWAQVGTIEQDGSYVFRQGIKQMGAYKDLDTGELVKPVNN